MNKRLTKIITALVTVSIASTVLVGCGGSKSTSSEGDTKVKESATAGKEVSYPIKNDGKLSYWVQLNAVVSPSCKSLNDTEWAKEMEKKSGIKVDFNHPAQGQEKEQFNLLIASGEFPDIIETGWPGFPGGPDKAIKDGIIISLNDAIDKYAPNFKKYLKENPDIEKAIKTDDGSIYYFPFVRGDEALTVCGGPILRADWLKELNLEVPTTIDEWENVLRTFKEKKGVAAPLTLRTTDDDLLTKFGAFAGAYGIRQDYYVDNGKVVYGSADPRYKDFLTLFNKWYKDGILDKGFGTVDNKIHTSNMLTGKSGATLGFAGGSIGGWIKAGKAKDPKYDLVAAPYPTLKKGDKPEFGQKDPKVKGIGAAITKNCKDIELATRYLDFCFTKQGEMISNFGTEGVSYKMENGYPKYTDLIMKNPDKLSVSQALGKYTRASYSGVFLQKKEYIEQFYEVKQQQDALKIWSNTNAEKHLLPNITPPAKDADELGKIDNDIDTYVKEMRIKFIMGTEPLSNFDKYMENLNKMGIAKSLKIRQDAFDKYNKR